MPCVVRPSGPTKSNNVLPVQIGGRTIGPLTPVQLPRVTLRDTLVGGSGADLHPPNRLRAEQHRHICCNHWGVCTLLKVIFTKTCAQSTLATLVCELSWQWHLHSFYQLHLPWAVFLLKVQGCSRQQSALFSWVPFVQARKNRDQASISSLCGLHICNWLSVVNPRDCLPYRR